MNYFIIFTLLAHYTSLIRILYGGSVTAANCRQLAACPDIDGSLVGWFLCSDKPFQIYSSEFHNFTYLFPRWCLIEEGLHRNSERYTVTQGSDLKMLARLLDPISVILESWCSFVIMYNNAFKTHTKLVNEVEYIYFLNSLFLVYKFTLH